MKKIAVGFIIFFCFTSFACAIDFGDVAPSSTVNSTKDCTAAASAGTITQGSPGNLEWNALNNAAAEDGKEASVDSHGKNPIKDTAARLILPDGSIGATDKSNGNNWTETSRYVSYGGDTWKANLTPQDINNPAFGFAIQIGGGNVNSYFLKAADFGFHIPSASTITGVTVEVKRREAPGENATIGYIDAIRMSVCYTSPVGGTNGTIPLILATMSDLKNIRVAPGEILSIPMTIRAINAQNLPVATIRYQIRTGDTIVMNETEFVKTLTATSPAETVAIPKNLTPGIYEAAGTLLLGGQTVPDIITFRFTVENKIGGIFISRLLYWGGILLLLCIAGAAANYFFASKRKIAVVHDYAGVPEPERVYYEMISDMVTQMHDSIGDRAYKMADAVAGLAVDKTTGRIINITKDPSEVVSVLFIKYQNVFKKKLKITARSKNKKTEDSAVTIEKNLEKFEKYFSKK